MMNTKKDSIYSCPHHAIKRELDALFRNNKKLAIANSHAYARIPLGDGMSYKKWCVFCGKPFNTVNETRQTCVDCQKEIFRKEKKREARRKAKKK